MSTLPLSQGTPGRYTMSLVALVTTFGGFIADWNETHVFNPNWPPHARFHNGQTMSMGACLGLTTLYYTWRRNPTLAAEKDSLVSAAWIASMYWVTQLSAVFYPGSLPMDPEFGEGFPQLYICVVLFGCIAVAFWLEKGRMERERVGRGEEKRA